MTTPMQDPASPEASRSRESEKTSVGELMGHISNDLSTLMRQELALAKAELRTEASKAGQSAGMFGGSGFAGYMTLLFLSIALWMGLDNVMDSGLAALIVAVLWGIVAAALFVLGRKKLQRVHPKPERTADTLNQTSDALKPSN